MMMMMMKEVLIIHLQKKRKATRAAQGGDEKDEGPGDEKHVQGEGEGPGDEKDVPGDEKDVPGDEKDEKAGDEKDEKPGEEKDEKDEKLGGKPKAKAKAKGKKGGKAQIAKENDDIRDQSKSKKFKQIWGDLPSDLQQHFNMLGREDQSKFINAGISRENGRLCTDTSAMYRLLVAREEAQKGLQKMRGFGLEDLCHQYNTPPATKLCGCFVFGPNSLDSNARYWVVALITQKQRGEHRHQVPYVP